MRWLCLWIVAMAGPASAFGAVTGRVSAIGFQSFIRAADWVPVVIQTTSDEPAAHTYDLQIVQNDLDGDDVVYTRSLTVNPGTQTFRTYFRPETVAGGLPASGADTPSDLAKRLRIFLFDPATGKRAVRIGVAGALPQAMESGSLSGNVGQKLILLVGRSPNVSEFVASRERTLGLAEQCFFVQVDPKRLPDTALAYGAVDAIVWTDADTGSRGLDATQLRAVRDYVRGGGTLVVIANADAARTRGFEDMLPVKVSGSLDVATREPLAALLRPPGRLPPRTAAGRLTDPWKFAAPPYRLADATPADDTTIVDAWAILSDGRQTPFIARRLFGLGCVAWIAEDISEPALATIDFGWPRLWERLMDWRDVDLTMTATLSPPALETEKARFASDTPRDLGASYYGGMNPESLTAVKITVAFAFFLAYWLLAGPGSYVFLAARKRTTLSWFVFAAVATGATLLTVGISQLVLRGSAQVRHVSLVRVRAGDAARVLSHVGVYLPKDTTGTPVTLAGTPDGPPAALTPFGFDPRYTPDSVNPRDSSYAVNVGQTSETSSVELDIPFRSTLKKLQADWSGPMAGGVGGQVRLVDAPALADPPLEGRVSNDTGTDLHDVILIFRGPDPQRGDVVIALPEWKKGQTYDLKSLWQSADAKPVTLRNGRLGLQLVGTAGPVRGRWLDGVAWLYDDLRASSSGIGLNAANLDDSGSGYARSFPLVSLFGRCPPMVNYPKDTSRVDLTRHGVRRWDVSPAVAAGAMVVLGQSTGPLPLPLAVDGETPGGTGQTFYQAILPIDRSLFNTPPTTQQAEPTAK